MSKRLPYVQSFDGYNYLRYKHQPRVALPSGPTSGSAFMAAYKAALAAAKKVDMPKKKRPSTSGTIGDAVDGYLASAAFKKLAPNTKKCRYAILKAWAKEVGTEPLADLTRNCLRRMLRNKGHTPGMARNWLNAVRAMYQDLIADDQIDEDSLPILGIKPPPSANPDGYKVWEPEHLEMYRRYWASGTVQRLALELLYWTGAACCDAVRLTRINFKDGLIEYQRQKTGEWAFVPVAPELERELVAAKVLTGAVVRLSDGEMLNEGEVADDGPLLRGPCWGRTFSARYLSQCIVEWAQAAGVPKGYSAHGIRKRAATDDAEAGRTTVQLKSKYGWGTNDQPDHYTRKADRRAIAMAMKAQTIH